jgi:hypothetical protein
MLYKWVCKLCSSSMTVHRPPLSQRRTTIKTLTLPVSSGKVQEEHGMPEKTPTNITSMQKGIQKLKHPPAPWKSQGRAPKTSPGHMNYGRNTPTWVRRLGASSVRAVRSCCTTRSHRCRGSHHSATPRDSNSRSATATRRYAEWTSSPTVDVHTQRLPELSACPLTWCCCSWSPVARRPRRPRLRFLRFLQH